MDVKKFRDVIGYGQDRKIKEKDSSGGIEAELVKTLENIVDSDGKITYTEREARKDINIEKVNIIVAGKTGVGKSSLINYIFGEEVAEVGDGVPITQEIQEYYMEKQGISLFDTKGLEAAEYKETVANIKSFLKGRQVLKDENEHIHIGWLCISESGGRVEEADKELMKILTDCGIPVVAVFTKKSTAKESEFVNKVMKENMLALVKGIVRVRNIEEKVEIEEGEIRLLPKGAEELLEETYRHVSEGKRNAIKKAQVIVLKDRLEVMVKEAAATTNKYTAMAAGIGTIPLPFADSIALAALQTKLIVDINTIYRVNAGAHTFTDIAAALISITGVAQIGKLAAGLLKVVPFVGWAANGGVAAAITKGIGFGYSEYLKSNVNPETGEVKLDLEDLKKNFMKFFEKFKNMEGS